MRRSTILVLLRVGLLLAAKAQENAARINYQRRKSDGSSPAKGLLDLPADRVKPRPGGNPVGAAVTVGGVALENGTFAVEWVVGVSVIAEGDRWP